MIYTEHQQKLAKEIDSDSSHSNWKDWKWQVKHRITSLNDLNKLLGLNLGKDKIDQIQKTIEKFPLSTIPYYLSLIDIENFENDPIYLQSVPSIKELSFSNADMADPLHEDKDSPVQGITHRYPDRVLFLVSNVCAMYCRHCTRKRTNRKA